MAITSGYFNSVNGDRKYNADQMSEYFEGIINEGVCQHIGGGLAVTAGTGLTVSVATGKAFIGQKWIKNDAAMTLTITTAADQARIDAVVLRRNTTNRVCEIAVKTGTPSASPSAPAMTRTSTTYEMALAYVNVAAGATSVTVTDKRSDSSVCGWATVAQQTSGEVDAQLNAMKTGFDGVEYASPAAMVQGCDTKLQGEIDEFEGLISSTSKGISDIFVDSNSYDIKIGAYSYDYTTSTGPWVSVVVDELSVVGNSVYNFIWESISSTYQENPRINFQTFNGDTKVADNYVYASAGKYSAYVASTITKIKIVAVVTSGSSPSVSGSYRIYNLFGYRNKMKLSNVFDVSSTTGVYEVDQDILKSVFNNGNIVYSSAQVKNNYLSNTGTYKYVQIQQMSVVASTKYVLYRGSTSGAVASSDLMLSLYNSSNQKITDIFLSTTDKYTIVTTTANADHAILYQILSLGTAPSSSGTVESNNIIFVEGLLSFADFIDVNAQIQDVRESSTKTALLLTKNADQLPSRLLKQIFISNTYNDLRYAGATGISETYAFDISNAADVVTIIAKDNNISLLAVSNTDIDDLTTGTSVTPIYDFTMINGEITIPAHAITGNSSLIITTAYQSTKSSTCMCVNGITDSYLKRPPLITFVDDDGYDEALDNWQTLADSLGIKNTFVVITGALGTDEPNGYYSSWKKVKRLASAGFDFQSHSDGHDDFTTLTDAEINADSEAVRNKMIQNGIDVRFVAYPGGMINSSKYDVVQENYEAGIAAGGSLLNKTPLNNMKVVRSSIVSGTTKTITVGGVDYTVYVPKTLNNIKIEIDKLIMNRGWLVFMTHLRNSYTDGYYYDSEISTLIQDVVKYAVGLNIPIKTFRDGYDVFKNKMAIGLPDSAIYYIVDCDGVVHEKTS